jgi:hypothetical protein
MHSTGRAAFSFFLALRFSRTKVCAAMLVRRRKQKIVSGQRVQENTHV